MNKIITILSLLYLVITITGCDQDVDYPYEGKDRIQFKHFTTNYNGSRTYSDSVVYSFGLKSTNIQIDTAKIVMEFLGEGSDRERIYHVSVVADSSSAVEGLHYEVINKEQKFRPNKLTDTLRIVVFRKNLSSSFKKPKSEKLYLMLEASDDFDLGLSKGRQMKLLLNNYLSEPTWWKKNFGANIGFYHPQKWRILISFNEKFANAASCPFEINNEGREYLQGLEKYLKDIPTYDEETGDRIYMNELVPVE